MAAYHYYRQFSKPACVAGHVKELLIEVIKDKTSLIPREEHLRGHASLSFTVVTEM